MANGSHANLLLPSAVSFTAKAVGVPLLQKGFQHYMRTFGSEVKGRMVDYVSRQDFQLPISVELSGLHSEISNFSLCIMFDDIGDFEGNVTASMDGTTRLLRNLSLTNAVLEQFLQQNAINYMIGLLNKICLLKLIQVCQ